MLRSYLGEIGHILIIFSFVSALVSSYLYFKSEKDDSAQWNRFGNFSFAFHTIFVVGVCITLFTIIFNHYFEYHYAWDNSSLSLPLGYAISCFWQDQEGSFLLWIFWNALIGSLLAYQFKKRKNELGNGSMLVISLIQVFLTSMILGTVLWGEFKLGSSPFLTLKESNPNLPIWSMDPNFVPKDGQGLNPLLQNYWMVIHPPTLFLGFALTMVPFALAITALWKRKYHEWLNLGLAWSLVAAVVLGTGIMMGGIWAYETLSFEGYWSWDPVENAVYVPWLVLVAAFHTLFLARKSTSALKYSFILIISQFILILYSTFLTRSGILGNASVHSFTDLGLSGQLLIYLLFFLVGSVLLAIFRWKELPKDEKESSVYSSEFWVFMGVLTLSLAAFQVIITTSIPVYNSIATSFGFELNMALPSDQVAHYTGFQMWLFIVAVVLMGIGQYFWWRKIKNEDFKAFLTPLSIALGISAVLIVTTGINNWKYVILVAASVFGIVANAGILKDLFQGKVKVAGGAMTHIGVALMLIGIMYSSAYQKTISINTSGQEIFQDSEKESRENVLLWLNRPYQSQSIDMTYKGRFVDVRKIPGYIEKRFVEQTPGGSFKGIARAPIVDGTDTLKLAGDTLEFEAENTYYQIAFETKNGKEFNLYPRFQINEKMGNVASPDIKRLWNKDIYAHVNYVQQDEEREWSLPIDYNVALKDTFFLNDYVAILEDVQGVREVDGLVLEEGDAAALATVRILERDGEKILRPAFVIKSNQVWSRPVESNELGLRIQLSRIDPTNGQFTFAVARSEREYIVLKAIEKPFMNVLWLGIGLLVIGMIASVIRRFKVALK